MLASSIVAVQTDRFHTTAQAQGISYGKAAASSCCRENCDDGQLIDSKSKAPCSSRSCSKHHHVCMQQARPCERDSLPCCICSPDVDHHMAKTHGGSDNACIYSGNMTKLEKPQSTPFNFPSSKQIQGQLHFLPARLKSVTSQSTANSLEWNSSHIILLQVAQLF
jgi:hypothetical protein